MAYGARLESALGESPRGFESPILRVRSERGAIACRLANETVKKPSEKSGGFCHFQRNLLLALEERLELRDDALESLHPLFI